MRRKHYNDITSWILLMVNVCTYFLKAELLLSTLLKKLVSKNHLPYKNYIHKQDFKFNQLKAKSHHKKYKANHC